MEDLDDLYSMTLNNGLKIAGAPFSYKNTIKAVVFNLWRTIIGSLLLLLPTELEEFQDSYWSIPRVILLILTLQGLPTQKLERY